MANIIIPDWNRRKLNPGFVWQEYIVIATQMITTSIFAQRYDSSRPHMETARDWWEQRVMAYIMERCSELGMHATKVVADCQDEPNPEKPLEAYIFQQYDLMFVWSIWACIDGPIGEEHAQPALRLPLEGFWPGSVNMLGGIAEVLDAETMLGMEQGRLVQQERME